jgi:hypothetical protein
MKNIQILKAYLKKTATEIKDTRLTLKDTQKGIKKDIPAYELEHKISKLKYVY